MVKSAHRFSFCLIKLLPRNTRGCILQCFVQVEADFFMDVSANLRSRNTRGCILQWFVQVEADFFIDVPANCATAFMVRLCFAVRLEIAVRQFCELGTSTFVTLAFWLSCCFVTCDSSVNSAHRLSSLSRSGSVAVSSRATVTQLVRVDLPKLVVFWRRCVSTVELSWASTAQCVPSLEL